MKYMMVIATIITIAAPLLFLWVSIKRIFERKKLKEHQNEWDAIRIRAIDNGATRTEIESMYRAYCGELVEKYGFGKCFFPNCFHRPERSVAE